MKNLNRILQAAGVRWHRLLFWPGMVGSGRSDSCELRIMNITFNEFSDRKSLVIKFADLIGELLTKGIIASGSASLAVSGGSTPVALFEQLSGMDISWQDVVITLVDERWVEPTEDDSNEHLVRTHLLRDKAAAAIFIGMKNGASTAAVGEVVCEQNIQKVPRPFDVLILGLDQEDPEILMEVIDGLWFIGDRRALSHLRRFLDHPNEEVRDSAEYAIENFK